MTATATGTCGRCGGEVLRDSARVITGCSGSCPLWMVIDGETGERAPTVTAQVLAGMASSNGHTTARDGKSDGEVTEGSRAQVLPTLSELLEGVESFIAQYVVLPSDDASAAQALFVAHSHAFDGAHSTPICC